jgi:hypothetical protein
MNYYPDQYYPRPTATEYILKVIDTGVNMPLTYILLMFSSVIIIYLANKLFTIHNDMERSMGNMTPSEYKAHTVSIHQFLVNNNNSWKIIKYLKPNSEYFNLVEYIIYIKKTDFEDIALYLDDNLKKLYMTEFEKYGDKQFKPCRNGICYLPVRDEDVVLFSNYPQLTFLRWVCQTGLDCFITKNFNKVKADYDEYIERLSKNTCDTDTSSDEEPEKDMTNTTDETDNTDNTDETEKKEK